VTGSHNNPPPPANEGDNAAIAVVNGDPEIPLDVSNGEGESAEASSISGYNSGVPIRGSNSGSTAGGKDGP
jgi:hypothetical protein